MVKAHFDLPSLMVDSSLRAHHRGKDLRMILAKSAILWISVALLAFAGSGNATTSQTFEVPKEQFLKYQVPLAGDDLKMKIVPDGQKAEKIESSAVQAEDDSVPWTPHAGNENNNNQPPYSEDTNKRGRTDSVQPQKGGQPFGLGNSPEDLRPDEIDFTLSLLFRFLPPLF
jgi:hypothetical protein